MLKKKNKQSQIYDILNILYCYVLNTTYFCSDDHNNFIFRERIGLEPFLLWPLNSLVLSQIETLNLSEAQCLGEGQRGLIWINEGTQVNILQLISYDLRLIKG